MRLFRFHFENEVKCGGCNWRTSNLYVLADTREEASNLLRKGEAGMCAECICELLNEEKYIILTEEDFKDLTRPLSEKFINKLVKKKVEEMLNRKVTIDIPEEWRGLNTFDELPERGATIVRDETGHELGIVEWETFIDVANGPNGLEEFAEPINVVFKPKNSRQ